MKRSAFFFLAAIIAASGLTSSTALAKRRPASKSRPVTKLQYSYEGSADARIAEHTGSPGGLASERLDVRFQQNANLGSAWTGTFGFSAWNDFIFRSRPDVYGDTVAGYDSKDIRPRNLYLRYQSHRFSLTAGYQQVVWGEALGTSYSDIVNPRDLRNGLYGDLSDIRLQTPMVNAKLIFDSVTLQALYIPQASFNLLPSPGNDYAYPFSKVLGGTSVEIHRQDSLPLTFSNAEYGGRLSALLGSWDFSGFYLNNFDRNPAYQLNSLSPTSIVVTETHKRVQNYGMTLTKEFGGFLFRLEAVVTENRQFPTINGFSLSSVDRSNPAYVVGFDLPTWSGINSTIQWSRDIVSGPFVTGLLRTQDQSLLTLRLARTVFFDHEIEFLETYSLTDQGSKSQLNYLLPTTKSSELRLGAEVYAGPFSSDFGKRETASRLIVLYRYLFHG